MPPGTAGTTTFLFTDIEGSTRLLQALGAAYGPLLDQHRVLLAGAIAAAGGRIFGTEGDAVFSSFATATAALVAAADGQRALAGHPWPDNGRIRVRMGIHTGEAIESDGNYVGLAVHQVARIMSAGHGGQVLVSEGTRRLAQLPPGLELRDLGERRLKDLAAPERLYQLVADGLGDRFPPLRTLDTRTNNLPVQLTSFVGRAELAVALEAFANTRLLTLTGPGGTGKTRLALQVAAESSDSFDDGVFFVPLDAISDAALVAPAIASAVGLEISGSTEPVVALVEFLADKNALLLLDNFEQVVEAAPIVARLLREAPQIKILVTTRIVLRLSGEQELPVPPLGLPAIDNGPLPADEALTYEAIALFVERARALQPSFALTDQTAPLVVDICRRLDGLPLAIELAAARTRALTVSAIHARLDQHLSLLTGGSRDLPGRQQTLRGAIDWSYDLLEPPERRLFERFSIHAGGASLAQAEAICGPSSELATDVLDGLASLAEKSLVRPDLTAGDDPRFAMLGTIRDYAHERLLGGPDFVDLSRRHALVYLELTETLAAEVMGADTRAVTDRLEVDHDNIRVALDWAVANGETQVALRFIVAAWRFWQRRGHLVEARRRIESVMAMPGLEAQADELRADAFGAAGGITYWQADAHATYRYYSQALEAAERSGDKQRIARALYDHGFAAIDADRLGDDIYRKGRPLWLRSLELYRELDDPQGISDAAWGLSQAYSADDDVDHALEYAQQALDGYRKLRDQFRIGWGAFVVATVQVRAGDLAAAEQNLRESLEIFGAANDRGGVLMNLAAFFLLARQRGQRTRELRLGGAAMKLRASTGTGLLDVPLDVLQFTMPVEPTEPADQAIWQEGERMSPEEAAAYALSDQDIDKPALSAD